MDNFDAGPSSAWPHKDFGSLFTRQSSKILKSNLRYKGWFNSVMYLAPGTAADWWLRQKGEIGPRETLVGDLCPHKTRGCFGEHGENCIFTTGQLALPVGQLAMIKRTIFMARYPDEFMALLYHELAVLQNYAAKGAGTGGPPRKLAIRLNGTSDIRWEKDRRYRRHDTTIFEDHPRVRFYDYTKVWERFLPKHGVTPPPLPKNYSLTFSSSEDNDEEVEKVLKTGGNVALVFDIRPTIGKTHMAPMVTKAFGYRVIDGDMHDLRFLDPPGVIVGLRAKGKLRHEVATGDSQFVRYVTLTPEYATGQAKYHPSDPFYPYGPNDFEGLGSPFAPEGFVQIGPVRARDAGAIKEDEGDDNG